MLSSTTTGEHKHFYWRHLNRVPEISLLHHVILSKTPFFSWRELSKSSLGSGPPPPPSHPRLPAEDRNHYVSSLSLHDPLHANPVRSPVLGFLATGAFLGPAGFSLIKDLNELDTLGELGISFLLFEQGLELSLDRLKALSKYAFGLGTAQVCLFLGFI